MTRLRRLAPLTTLVAGALVALTGCGFTGLYSTSLPGSVSGNTYTVTVYFDNVLDLVPQAAVKVNDVTVGTITKIKVVDDAKSGHYLARVTCTVKKSVHLPANTVAILEETSLLGEKFVELRQPDKPTGELLDGAVIRDGATTAYPDVEEVFGVLSSVLNGGGLQKLQTINIEVSKALAGRESQVRDVLRQLNVFLSGLASQRAQINHALSALDRLSRDLAAQESSIATALDDIGPGLKILADQRSQLVGLLEGLSRLGVVSTRVINASLDNTRASFTYLAPILSKLAAAGKALPGSLEMLVDYPFPRHSVSGIPGDFTSLYVSLNAGSACNQAPATKPLCVALSTLGFLTTSGTPAAANRRGSTPTVAGLSPAGRVSRTHVRGGLMTLLMGGAQ